MKIRLKECMDKKGINMEELQKAVDIDPVLLENMYEKGIFDSEKNGVQMISELMLALNVSKINELVPDIK